MAPAPEGQPPTPTLILIVDRASRCCYANEAARALLATDAVGPQNDLAGRQLHDLLGESAYERLAPSIRQAFAGHPSHVELTLTGQNDLPSSLTVTCLPQPPDAPVPEAVLLVLFDTTDRMNLRAGQTPSLADTQLLYQLTKVLESAPTLAAAQEPVLDLLLEGFAINRAAIHVADGDRRLLCAAQRNLTAAAVAASETAAEIAYSSATPHLIHVTDLDDTTSAGELLGGIGIVDALRAEGISAVLWAPLRQGPLVEGMLAIYASHPGAFGERDRTLLAAMAVHLATALARKQTDGERSRLIDELTRTIHLNELFTGILGHDLRNPLQSMLTAAEILIRRAPDPKVATTARRIVTSGNRMNRMIEQLLDFTRIRAAGTVPIERSITDVAAVWRQAVEEFASKGAIRVQFEYSGDTLGSWDPDRLAQVASNLIANAIRHGNADGPVAIEVDGTDQASIQIFVHNEGCIPATILPRLFEPFQSGDRVRSRGEGLGLGLFITRQIVEAHGGSIEVASTAASGTEFAIRLPRRQAPASPDAERDADLLAQH